MKLTIQAVSSSTEGGYPVEFSDDSGVFRVFCHCQAGVNQMMCKHKAAFIRGDAKMLLNPEDAALLKKIQSSPAYPALRERYEHFESQLTEVQIEMEKLKQIERGIKKDFAHELTSGKRPVSIPVGRTIYAKRPAVES